MNEKKISARKLLFTASSPKRSTHAISVPFRGAAPHLVPHLEIEAISTKGAECAALFFPPLFRAAETRYFLSGNLAYSSRHRGWKGAFVRISSKVRTLAAVSLALLAQIAVVPSVSAKPAKRAHSDYQQPVEMTSAQDHQRIMDLLHITALRPAPTADQSKPNHANYDEAKAGAFPNYPDPLILNDGSPVTSAKIWWTDRRPQILEAFDSQVYGRVPAHTPRVHWRVSGAKPESIGGIPAVTRELTGQVDNSSYPLITVNIQATLTLPAEARGPVPVMIDFGIDPAVMQRIMAMLKARGQKFPPLPAGPSWQQQVLERGWGYAVLIPTSYQDDNGAGLTKGIIGLCNRGRPRGLEDWGALRAWSWGASRLLDYFETDPQVDAKHVGIEGLSRYGKAALVTMAYDQRFAIGLIGSSGAGGAKLFRRNFGESIADLAAVNEYHWFAGNFVKYAASLNAGDLPVDAHELFALCAPRPVFLSEGSPAVEGNWLDDEGQFMAEVDAGPVYRLLGKRDLGTDSMPPIGTALLSGDLAFRQHQYGHTDIPNWPAFLKFAARYM
jgi:(4-O-methyl)-D-glucuronate---lignin esterase